MPKSQAELKELESIHKVSTNDNILLNLLPILEVEFSQKEIKMYWPNTLEVVFRIIGNVSEIYTSMTVSSCGNHILQELCLCGTS